MTSSGVHASSPTHCYSPSLPPFFLLIRYVAAQARLNGDGVTSLCLAAIATYPAGRRGNAASSAIDLLKELLFGGNQSVQQTVSPPPSSPPPRSNLTYASLIILQYAFVECAGSLVLNLTVLDIFCYSHSVT